jgi:hypothetical protein
VSHKLLSNIVLIVFLERQNVAVAAVLRTVLSALNRHKLSIAPVSEKAAASYSFLAHII